MEPAARLAGTGFAVNRITMGYFPVREGADLPAHAVRRPPCSDQQIDELRLDSESIIFEITPDGWCAMKLTRMGWFRGRALTIRDATAALCAQIRAALAPR